MRDSLGLVLVSLGVAGCLGPDLTFVGEGEGGGGGSATALSSASTAAEGGGGPGPATTNGSGAGGTGGTGAGGAECVDPTDCPDTGELCLERTCTDGACGTSPLPDGVELSGQTAGDCKVMTCEGGSTVEVADDGDLPDDVDECIVEGCDGGVPTSDPEPVDTPCGLDGALRCDGDGTCIGCTDPGQCPGTDDACKTRTCVGDVCGFDFEPLGTLATQIVGNCQEEVCDGAGDVIGNDDDGDLPEDFNECTDDACDGGVPSNDPSDPGAPCGTGASCTEPPAMAKGEDVCDGLGACDVQVPQACTAPSQCFVPVCSGVTCDTGFALPDTPCDLFSTLDGFCDGGGSCLECTGDGQCQGTDVCSGGTCVATEKLVFVTAEAVLPTLGGTAGGDTVCQTAALGAGLPGTYRAWLSDSGSSPATTFTQASVPYRLVDGTTIANDWADLVDGALLAGISLAQDGTTISFGEVWTGTSALGEATGDDCSGWSSTLGTGFVGLSATPDTWSTVYSQFCDRDNVRLYCFEQ